MPQTSPELNLSGGRPDRLVVFTDDITRSESTYLATNAVYIARMTMPRVTGGTARRLVPIYGEGWFGIYWPDPQTWYMEQGTKPFTMRSLAGKTIPMWVSDEDGSLRQKNSKIRTRTTEDSRLQVLIFRKASPLGQRKTVRKKNRATGLMETSTAPASYPGAPGRIARRTPGQPWTPAGSRGGAIATGNVGVRWRHPGIRAMSFLNAALTDAAFDAGINVARIYVLDAESFNTTMSRRS